MAGAIAVLNYDLVGYKRTWRGSVMSSFVLPVLFVLGFGISVGSLVNTQSARRRVIPVVPGARHDRVDRAAGRVR